MIKLANKNECTGCSACYSVCQNNAISMKPDNTGFLFPLIDLENCIQCGKCQKVCPVLNIVSPVISLSKEYIARFLDKDILKNSSSGAISYALALYVLKRKGYVFGVVTDKKFRVYHTSVDNITDLSQLQGSKYVQSDIRNSYREIISILEQDKYVLFTGTPCQIYGLKSILPKNYEKLICVDIFCRSVASPLLFKKYVELQSVMLGKIQTILFKNKIRGYDYPVMKIKYWDKDSKKTYLRGSESDQWLRLFLSNEGDRPACKNCIADRFGHCSDISIGDFNDRSKIPKDMNDNLGCSHVIINTNKGLILFNEISDLIEYKIINTVNTNTVRPASVCGNKFNKDKFYEDANILNGKDFFQKYYPVTFRVRVLRLIRETLFITGIYSVIKLVKRKTNAFLNCRRRK